MSNKMICNEPLHQQCYMKGQCVKYDKCPMVLVQDLLTGKWKILILWYLSYKNLRFSDIMKRLPQVTQKMLTMQYRRSLKTNPTQTNRKLQLQLHSGSNLLPLKSKKIWKQVTPMQQHSKKTKVIQYLSGTNLLATTYTV